MHPLLLEKFAGAIAIARGLEADAWFGRKPGALDWSLPAVRPRRLRFDEDGAEEDVELPAGE